MRIIPFGAGSTYEAKLLKGELADFRALAVAVDVRPPPTNRGVNFSCPPSFSDGQKSKADWLSFTSSVGIVPLKIIVALMLPGVVLTLGSHGMLGYPQMYTLTVNDVQVGILGFGAEHGKDLVSISGKGCSSWDSSVYGWIVDCLEVAEAKITRLDLCMDFYRGELSFDAALIAYHDGEFNPLKGGKKFPLLDIRGLLKDKTINLGRTMYVGSVKSSKRCRAYEKGLEIFSRMSDSFRESCTAPGDLVYDDQNAPVGTIADQWFRVEVEWKSKTYDLTFDMLTNRDKYFAGAYPFCARILDLGDGLRPEYLKQDDEVDNEKMFNAAKRGYGSAVHTWKACGYSDAQIIERLDSGSHNLRMVKAGILAAHAQNQVLDCPF